MVCKHRGMHVFFGPSWVLITMASRSVEEKRVKRRGHYTVGHTTQPINRSISRRSLLIDLLIDLLLIVDILLGLLIDILLGLLY